MPSTPENPTSNSILEWIHQILGNLVRTFNTKDTYVYEDGPWLENLEAAVFTILST